MLRHPILTKLDLTTLVLTLLVIKINETLFIFHFLSALLPSVETFVVPVQLMIILYVLLSKLPVDRSPKIHIGFQNPQRHCLDSLGKSMGKSIKKTRKSIIKSSSRIGNRPEADYAKIVAKIQQLKVHSKLLFTRMYRLLHTSFDKVLHIIEPDLKPTGRRGKHIIPPIIKLCLGLKFLTGGSYLDLSFGYEVPPSVVHYYAWQALHAIDNSTDPFLDNIKSPVHASDDKLMELEEGFASLSKFKLRGTVAAGDGLVFHMVMPTNEEVDDDVTSYYTRKGYYAYGLQVTYVFLFFL
jgi:hypothetical protein